MGWAIGTMAAGLSRLWHFWTNQLGGTLLLPGSTLSLGGLGVTLALAAWLAVPRHRRGRPLRLAVLRRALFPHRLTRSASGRADIAYAAFSLLFFGLAFGWAFVSSERIAGGLGAALTDLFGAPPAAVLPGWAAAAIATAAIFLAYEFAYWLDHYLCHKLPVLWHFHRVHHAAESLSLLTNFRVHPVDTILFYSLVSLFTGAAAALCGWLLGRPAAPFAVGGTNILILASAILLTHLQHSHLWIGFGRRWGRVLLSPAHHQIHHSTDPRHFDRNFGSSLALWDWLFGTLHVPADRREPLRFGLGGDEPAPHGLKAALLTPFAGAVATVRDAVRSSSQRR